jgi:nitric-oxide synthase
LRRLSSRRLSLFNIYYFCSIIVKMQDQPAGPLGVEGLVLGARELLEQLWQEGRLSSLPGERLQGIQREAAQSGTYSQTREELEYSAKLAWRNSIRCVGRSYWPTLSVFDCRDLETAEQIFEALVDHIRFSTNGGQIRPRITVFAHRQPDRADIRIWNDQLIRYAGYRLSDGSVVGDPLQVELTERVTRLGWKGAKGTPFDLLPLVIQIGGLPPRLFDLPRDAVLEVRLGHPDFGWMEQLGLRWYALPAVSSLSLEAGGLIYPAAPFSGWYLGSEVAARNFADVGRYNVLPALASAMGLDMRREETLWRDKALVELNVAVLWSYRRAGVKMVDHHTVTRHFVGFEDREARQGRATYADWAWMVPPLSGSTTPVFHRHYLSHEIKPNFFAQPAPWGSVRQESVCPHATAIQWEAAPGSRLVPEGACPIREESCEPAEEAFYGGLQDLVSGTPS